MSADDSTCFQLPARIEGEVFTFAVYFGNELKNGELLTGTPTATELGGNGNLTINNLAVNTVAINVDDVSRPIGTCVTGLIQGQLPANSPYKIRLQCATDGGLLGIAQTKRLFIRFVCNDEDG